MFVTIKIPLQGPEGRCNPKCGMYCPHTTEPLSKLRVATAYRRMLRSFTTVPSLTEAVWLVKYACTGTPVQFEIPGERFEEFSSMIAMTGSQLVEVPHDKAAVRQLKRANEQWGLR